MAELFEIADYRAREDFRTRSAGRPRDAGPVGAGAEILIYTGIRYERMECCTDRSGEASVSRAEALARRGA